MREKTRREEEESNRFLFKSLRLLIIIRSQSSFVRGAPHNLNTYLKQASPSQTLTLNFRVSFSFSFFLTTMGIPSFSFTMALSNLVYYESSSDVKLKDVKLATRNEFNVFCLIKRSSIDFTNGL